MKPNGRGSGRVFRVPNSRFWHCAFYLNGKEIRESTHVEFLDPDPGQKAERAALKYLKAKLDACAAERGGGPELITPAMKRVTVNELLDGLVADYQTRRKYNRKVESNLKPLRKQFGHIRAVDLNKQMVTAYMVKLQQQGFRDSTINRYVQLLLQSFTIAEREAPHVKRLSEIGNVRKGFFERGEFLRVVANLPEYLKDFCRFAYVTGWRKGGITNIEWADVDDAKVYLRAIHSKNRRPVTVPLVGEVAEIIARRKAAQVVRSSNGEVKFCKNVFHRHGKPIGDIRKAWANACDAAGVPGKLFHDFRRTAARNLVVSGVAEATAMQITGHVTNSMFKRYSIVSEEQKENALIEVANRLRAEDERQTRTAVAVQ